MKTITKYLAPLMIFVVSIAILAKDDGPSITCNLGGVMKTFHRGAKAVYSPKDGLEIHGVGGDPKSGGEFIGIHVPFARKGTFTLRDTPAPSLNYIRSLYSSDLGDKYFAGTNTKSSALNVTITKCGEIGETVEGSFSGVLKTQRDREIIVTNGFFTVLREKPTPR